MLDESQVDLQVGGRVGDVRLEPRLSAYRGRPFSGGGANGFHHEWTRRQPRQGSLAPSSWDDEAKLVGEQVVTPGLAKSRQGVSGVLLAEDDVELAGYEGWQGDLGLDLGHLDPQPGVLLLELGEGVRHDSEDCGLEGGDAQLADGLVQGLAASDHWLRRWCGTTDAPAPLGHAREVAQRLAAQLRDLEGQREALPIWARGQRRDLTARVEGPCNDWFHQHANDHVDRAEGAVETATRVVDAESAQRLADDRADRQYRHQQWLQRSLRPYVDPNRVITPDGPLDRGNSPRRQAHDRYPAQPRSPGHGRSP